MGNIFAVVSPENVWSKPEELFKAGVDLARRIKSQAPKNTIDVAYARAASFARRAHGSKACGESIASAGSDQYDIATVLPRE